MRSKLHQLNDALNAADPCRASMQCCGTVAVRVQLSDGPAWEAYHHLYRWVEGEGVVDLGHITSGRI